MAGERAPQIRIVNHPPVALIIALRYSFARYCFDSYNTVTIMQPILTFVQLTDSHLGPTPDFELYDSYPTLPCLQRAVKVINGFPQPPDFVVHTGDLSNDGSAASYDLAADVMAQLTVPVYYVNGNHDDRALLRKYFGMPGEPDAPLEYTFEVKGERFLVLDAYDPAVAQPNGHMRAASLEFVRREATPDGPPLTVLLHYPLFSMGSPWLDKHMIVLNGEDLHAALHPARDRLRGVFYGHLHRSVQIKRDGITYTCAGSTVVGYEWRPWDAKPQIDHAFPPSYTVVQIFDDQVIAHQYTFPRPSQGG